MRRRYFTRVLTAFGNYRPGHEVALEADEFAAVKGKGIVSVLHEEHDGKRVDVKADEGASSTPPAKTRDETFPVDTLTDEEKDLISKRRAGLERKKADEEAKAKAEAEKATKAEAEKIERAAKKKADEEAKAKANDKK